MVPEDCTLIKRTNGIVLWSWYCARMDCISGSSFLCNFILRSAPARESPGKN